MNESGFWKKLKRGFPPRLWIERIDVSTRPGWPDVHYCFKNKTGTTGISGWIELKYLKEHPKYKDLTKIRNLTAEQALWLEQYMKAGGLSWLLLGIVNEVYLIPGIYAREFIAGVTLKRLLEMSTVFFTNRITYEILIAALCKKDLERIKKSKAYYIYPNNYGDMPPIGKVTINEVKSEYISAPPMYLDPNNYGQITMVGGSKAKEAIKKFADKKQGKKK